MKLIYRVVIRLSISLSIILTIWAGLFYAAMIDELNDEIDDSLDDYSELIMARFLAGESIPTVSTNSNNQYYLKEISREEALNRRRVRYIDTMVYLPLKKETEPARVRSAVYHKGMGEKYYRLDVYTPTVEKHDLKESILSWIIFLYICLLLTIIAVNIWIYERINRPLYRLLSWMDGYKVGEANPALNNPTIILEFDKLNKAAVRNMERAEELFESQKLFIGNASHEMQTPIAVCLNRIDTLMEDETLSENQLAELAKTQQMLDYLSKLNKALMLLFKIDNHQFVEKKELDFNALVHQMLPNYSDAYEHMDISLKIVENGVFRTKMNEILGSILIGNFIKNGYVHNIQGGEFVVELSDNKIVFRNSGVDTPLDPLQIFNKFYQGSKKQGSLGLGLALVKSICEVEHLQVIYYFDAQSRHCFELSRQNKV
ncbi:sensor histidine kinase [Porphyromonas canoris]|uniref:histidine kinase n=1 Tax=Porphyromonas canoris TaxID=36875 RepID=A0ABR4XLV6_9PORP|nr:HAMP domain-containing sensor histidine kinase [Porphyromonas canoris]KGN92548.1 histidine kinase [Porphyromonas canoris]